MGGESRINSEYFYQGVRGLQLYFLVALVISLVIAILAVQNPSVASVRFLFWELPNTSLVVLILGSALGGGLAVMAFDLVRFWKMRVRLKQYAHENQLLKKQLDKALKDQDEDLKSKPVSL